ncbi:MAG: hypothetical protein NC121_20660, partial [Blautia sp.]|nr:hypothetical protein [Blautia sp.]
MSEEENKKPEERRLKKVSGINVIRSDSDPASSYVICSRICQQMQIADLVIVDVSTQNPNVFYEFGMAVALEKMILPICFSESFYKLDVPEKLRELKAESDKKTGLLYHTAEDEPKKDPYDEILHHIGCYPWRKTLFEYYGICFKQYVPESDRDDTYPVSIKYIDFEDATKEAYGFTDIQYNRFPYDAKIKIEGITEEVKIGSKIYEILKSHYNQADREDNTLVVYTIDGFLNEDQAGRCIVNFYHNITEKMQEEQCFCGERVGVLVQAQVIPDNDKDAKKERHILYNVGEIIHIGVDQATYLASKEKVKAEDVLRYLYKDRESESVFRKETKGYIKEFIGNRGMIMYPDYPVYVKRIKSQIIPDPFNDIEQEAPFCLYHVMLKNLRYTNEIVVDITNNCLQSLFWLGAAHGSEVDAITVKQELSERERIMLEGDAVDKNRNVFDVSGLWTAYYYSHDTEGFYHQLALAQFGIEKHSKIIPYDVKWYGLKKWEYLEYDKVGDHGDHRNFYHEDQRNDKAAESAQKQRKLALESYYRRKFWNAMLRYNRLRIYMPQHDDVDHEDHEPRLRAAKWDIDAVSGLTHYLSKRSVIGDYLVITLPEKMADDMAEKVNFICIGQPVTPLQKNLSEHIRQKWQGAQNDQYRKYHHFNVIHEYGRTGDHSMEVFDSVNGKKKIVFQGKGFVCEELSRHDRQRLFRDHPWSVCEDCESLPMRYEQQCPFKGHPSHKEIAQLILWREDNKEAGDQHFRVSLIGSSGPATFGLSSLFVDEGQKLRDLIDLNTARGSDENGIKDFDNTLLYALQEKVRGKMIALICHDLQVKISGNIKQDIREEKQEHYVKQVLYAVRSYLRTILYRYFLPFLTEKDMNRICNETVMFVNTLKAAKQSPFYLDDQFWVNNDKDVIQAFYENRTTDISGTLREILFNFKGLEAFYEIEVTHRSTEKSVQNPSEDSGSDPVQDKPYCIRADSSAGWQSREKKNKRQKDNRRITSIKMLNEI